MCGNPTTVEGEVRAAGAWESLHHFKQISATFPSEEISHLANVSFGPCVSFGELRNHACKLRNHADTQPLKRFKRSKVYARGSQPGVHVPLGVHLPIRRGTFMVRNSR